MGDSPDTRPLRRALVQVLWHGGWALVALAAFAWHFRWLEAALPEWGYRQFTQWRLYEALALIPLAVGLAWLFRGRRYQAVLVPVGFWLTLAGPFDTKLVELNAPLLPSDVTLIFRQFRGLRTIEQVALSLWLVLGLAVAGAVLRQWLRSRWRTRLLAAGGFLLSAATMALLGYQTILAQRANPNPRWLATTHGQLAFYAAHAERWLFERMPSRDEAAAAQASLRHNDLLMGDGVTTGVVPSRPKTSLYIVLAESWLDPMDLGIPLSADPFPPRLRAWMRQSHSRLLVSTSRGGTASTEFELLSGLPAQLNDLGYGIEFRNFIRQPLPGLARQVKQAGIPADLYTATTVDFYEEISAYLNFGFSAIKAGFQFDRADLDGPCLSDESFFAQATRDIVAHRQPRHPALHYLVTIAGHYPFVCNPQTRPPIITCTPRSEAIETLVNRMAYSSRALLGLIDHLKAVDPEASLVVFGDHSPQPSAALEATPYYQDPATVYSTPLLWLDRLETPIPLGRLPAYGLHYLALRHFGLRPAPWAEPFAKAAEKGLRNYPEIGRFSYRDEAPDTAHWCPDPLGAGNGCAKGSDFFQDAKVVALDVLSGSQHGLKTPTAARAGDASHP